jgi:hypothetical protein
MAPLSHEQELYRAEFNAAPVLSIVAEVPDWAPQPRLLPTPTLRWMLAEALRPFLSARRAA